MEHPIVDEVRRLAPDLVRIERAFECHYDKEADVLYVSLEPGAEADDSELTPDNLVLRYREGRLVGITVMNASKLGELRASA